MERIHGQITDIGTDGYITIRAALPNIDRALLRQYKDVEILLDDGRTITVDQRKKLFALFNEISEATGYMPVEAIKEMTKVFFMARQPIPVHFSLSNTDVTTAREFISCVIDFIIEYGIPVKTPLIDLCEDISRYVYSCICSKRCCVCGASQVDLHHVEAIGMGRDRTEVLQIGIPILSLCREHHTESHKIGQQTFLAKHHLQTIKLTKEIGKIYNLTKANLGG